MSGGMTCGMQLGVFRARVPLLSGHKNKKQNFKKIFLGQKENKSKKIKIVDK